MMEKGGFTEDPRELQLEMVFSLNRLPASEEKKEADPMWSGDSSNPKDWFLYEE